MAQSELLSEGGQRSCLAEHTFAILTCMSTTTELLLPLDEITNANDLRSRRWQHLMTVAGVEPAAAERLARAFPSLAAVYRADEAQLVTVVGPVVAARMRWFLDAPLDTGLSVQSISRARAA